MQRDYANARLHKDSGKRLQYLAHGMQVWQNSELFILLYNMMTRLKVIKSHKLKSIKY